MGGAHDVVKAVWQTDIGGLQWIDDLVEQQHAINLGGSGYPCRYIALAKHIIPRIRDEEPPEAKAVWTFDQHDIILPGWHGKTTKNTHAMDACRPDE